MKSVLLKSGQIVRFALGKVICPAIDELQKKMGSELEIEGQVVFLSDYGKVRGHFAIVQVKGMHVPLIVQTENLQFIEQSGLPTKRMIVSKDKLVG